MERFVKCPFCGEKIKKGNRHHKCRQKEEFVNGDFCEELKYLYLDCEYSISDLGKYFNEKYKEILFDKISDSFFRKIVKCVLPNDYRNLNDSVKTKKSREKYTKTMVETYGYSHNFNKGCESRLKWENALLKNEGITNVFQRESVKNKIQETLLQKYGTEDGIKKMRGYFSTIDGFKEKYGDEWEEKWQKLIESKKTMSKDFYISKFGDCWEEKWDEHIQRIKNKFKSVRLNGLNKKCYEILQKNNILFESEFPIERDDEYKKIYGGELFFYDIKVGNLLIELNGTYWHCDPRKYKSSDIVKFPNNVIKNVNDVWFKDECKKQTALKNGYFFETIWEEDFNENVLLEILKKYKLWNK